jgi:hypothetical protein
MSAILHRQAFYAARAGPLLKIGTGLYSLIWFAFSSFPQKNSSQFLFKIIFYDSHTH